MRLIVLILVFGISLGIYSQENKTLWTAAWSPNGKYIAIGGNQNALKIFDGITYELIQSYPVEEVILSRLKWHPTENKLAVITQSSTFKAKILELDKKQWIELEGLENSLRALDWNYNGELLAVSNYDGEIRIFDTQGNNVSTFSADAKSVTGIDWHPSENILVAVGSTIGIFTSSGETITKFSPRDQEVFLLCVEWHQSGEFFVSGDYGFLEDGRDKLIQYWNASGKKITETPASQVEYRNIRWSPDGKVLASANDALRLWDTEGNLIYESKASKDYLWGIDWSPNGRYIITSSDQGIVRLWDKNGEFIQYIKF